MTGDVTKEYLDELIADGNYLGAVLALRRERRELGQILYDEYLGRISAAVVADLESVRSRDKVVYLRSVLRLVFQDVPELERIYRDQLREDRGRPDLFRGAMDGIRSIAGTTEACRRVEDGINDIRRGVERGLDRGNIDSGVKSVLDAAEKGLRDGLQTLAGMFDDVEAASEAKPHDDAESGDYETVEEAETTVINVEVEGDAYGGEKDSKAAKDSGGSGETDNAGSSKAGGTTRKKT